MESIDRNEKLKDTFKTLKILGDQFDDSVYDNVEIMLDDEGMDVLISELVNQKDTKVPLKIGTHEFTLMLNF